MSGTGWNLTDLRRQVLVATTVKPQTFTDLLQMCSTVLRGSPVDRAAKELLIAGGKKDVDDLIHSCWSVVKVSESWNVDDDMIRNNMTLIKADVFRQLTTTLGQNVDEWSGKINDIVVSDLLRGLNEQDILVNGERHLFNASFPSLIISLDLNITLTRSVVLSLVKIHPVVGLVIIFAKLVLEQSMYSRILFVMFNFGLLCNIDLISFKDICGLITSFVKRVDHSIVHDWFLYVNLEMWLGYNNVSSLADRIDDIKSWGTGELYVGDSSPSFKKLFKQGLSHFFPMGVLPQNFNGISLKDFTTRPSLWVTTGAGNVIKSRVAANWGVKTKDLKKNRSLWATQVSEESIHSDLREASGVDFLKPALKVELGQKDRIIISASENMQIMMAYVSYYLEPIFQQTVTATPLFGGIKALQDMWEAMHVKISRHYGAAFPYDTAAFDHTIGTNEIIWFFEWLVDVVEGAGEMFHSDVLSTVYHLARRFRQQRIWFDGLEIGIWEHGIPSGIRWTAWMDSAINLARQFVVLRLLSVIDPNLSSTELWGQGDDVALFFAHPIHALLWFSVVNYLGYTAHAKKNWLSFGDGRQCEFLRKVLSKSGTFGYITRKLGGAVYRDPTKREFLGVEEKINRDWASYNTLVMRGASSFKCLDIFINNVLHILSLYLSINKEEVWQWVTCLKCYNGFGLYETRNLGSLGLSFIVRGSKSQEMILAPVGLFSNEYNDMIQAHPKLQLGLNSYSRQLADRVLNIKHSEQRVPSHLIYQDIPFVRFSDAKCFPDGSTVPDGWVPRKNLDPVLCRGAAAELLRAGDIAAILDLTHVGNLKMTELVLRGWARAVQFDYLSGSLGFSCPRVLGWDDFELFLIFNYCRKLVMGELLGKHRVSKLHMLRAHHRCEMMVRYCISQKPFKGSRWTS